MLAWVEELDRRDEMHKAPRGRMLALSLARRLRELPDNFKWDYLKTLYVVRLDELSGTTRWGGDAVGLAIVTWPDIIGCHSDNPDDLAEAMEVALPNNALRSRLGMPQNEFIQVLIAQDNLLGLATSPEVIAERLEAWAVMVARESLLSRARRYLVWMTGS